MPLLQNGVHHGGRKLVVDDANVCEIPCESNDVAFHSLILR
jgi:hypothetical protein